MADISVGDVVKVDGYNKYVAYRVTALPESGHLAQLVEIRQWASPQSVQRNITRLVKVCPEIVHEPGRGMGWHVCGRKLKDEGLCGLHLSARTRAKERAERYAATREANVEKTNQMRTEITRRGLQDRVKIWDTEKELVLVKLDDLLDLIRNS